MQNKKNPYIHKAWIQNSFFFHSPINNAVKGKNKYFRVSMPYLGLTPFLQNRDNRDVSMPYLGLTPFLPRTSIDVVTNIEGCQCPISGLLHFYRNGLVHQFTKRNVSMPYLGLTPFLLSQKGGFVMKTIFVSMPYLGLTPFLPCLSGSPYSSGFPDPFLQVFFGVS